jgi:rhodanese-related sulfurtransferase
MYGISEIDAETLDSLRREGAVDLVDVRTEAEVAQGVIEGARHVPLHLVPIREGDFNRDIATVFYCRSGSRSAQACMYMAGRGHGQVYNLRGGVIDWNRSGRRLIA